MSIGFEDMARVTENYERVRNYVIGVLGRDLLNSNHYGQTLLFNQIISIDTPRDKLVEIWNKYVNLFNEIDKIFSDNDLEIKDEYFDEDSMSGIVTFLNIPIDNDISKFRIPILTFISLKKKVDRLISQYRDLKNIDIQLSHFKPYKFLLLGNSIDSKTNDEDIRLIINSYYCLNTRVNKLLKFCDNKKNDILYTTGNANFYIFGNKINAEMSDSELLEIINKVQFFESKVKCAMEELKIIEHYRFDYTTDIHMLLRGTYHLFNINMTYDDIKNELIDMDKLYNFKKK